MGRKKQQSGQFLFELPEWMTRMTLVGKDGTEAEITDWVVHKACREMEDKQQFPFKGRTLKKKHL